MTLSSRAILNPPRAKPVSFKPNTCWVYPGKVQALSLETSRGKTKLCARLLGPVRKIHNVPLQILLLTEVRMG